MNSWFEKPQTYSFEILSSYHYNKANFQQIDDSIGFNKL